MVTRGLEATRARVREHLDAGATSVVIQVLGRPSTSRRAPTGPRWPRRCCEQPTAAARWVAGVVARLRVGDRDRGSRGYSGVI
jgi:hypothetical protein